MDKEVLKLANEYRPSMNIEVLHSWAKDMQVALKQALEQPAQPASVQEPLTWQPIDTAPKDGATIWLGEPHSIRLGFWSIDYWVDSASAEARGYRGVGFVPTHWMPMPAAPIEAAHGIGGEA